MKTHKPGDMRLPLRTAIFIAYQNIRRRLGRSLLVTSGIILAVAFLMSILTTSAVAAGMRGWISQPLPGDTAAIHAQRLALQTAMEANGLPVTPAEITADRTQHRWVLGLAMLVAFIGILNAMLMSVTERFAEIGTMKCLGALDGFIAQLFLIESLFQGVAGSLIGILAGLILSVTGLIAAYGLESWRTLPAEEVLQSSLICLAIGICLTVAGAVYPAWLAARMQPIAAMRAEM